MVPPDLKKMKASKCAELGERHAWLVAMRKIVNQRENPRFGGTIASGLTTKLCTASQIERYDLYKLIHAGAWESWAIRWAQCVLPPSADFSPCVQAAGWRIWVERGLTGGEFEHWTGGARRHAEDGVTAMGVGVAQGLVLAILKVLIAECERYLEGCRQKETTHG